MTNTSKKSLEEKIAKLDALIASTTHKGEKDSAIFAREKLLKKLKKHAKHEKSTKQKRSSEEPKKREKKPVDDFFYRKENCLRKSWDRSKASFYQKRFICGLVERANLSCPPSFLQKFVNSLGLEQATRIINNLIEIAGDPRENPATKRQVAFLKKNLVLGLSEDLIGILKSRDASKIIGAIKIIKELEDSLKGPEIEKLRTFLEEE
uniref:Uncharacterized protein n=1 Tax=Candidatus Kentrum sp. SD TaxID=2126332 RepID=A0A450Z4U0_9GAMM|nr:MAG: hypothetical protein BECKSD772F_GA0070984_11399 [Candidatus Kentron sp. SD]VFK48814.1 MAG: hypothetical protein BECKSD772E_GA0070983_11439 [Candidatus Kentron sp. SD]VFK80630.1 MAG: hypothetical protein BECKSD772D_GA0070982_11349 [Candidatus Kentron sp. SD]